MYDNAYQEYLGRAKKVTIIIGMIILLICGGLAFLSVPVSAKETTNSTLSVVEITDTTIEWNYTYKTSARPIGATLDGVIIEGFKTDYVFNYTASGLKPNTTHEFCLFGEATSNCVEGTTLSPQGDLDKIFGILYLYTCAIIALVFIYVTFAYKQNEFALIAGLLAFLGLGIVGNNVIAQIIYGLILIVAFIVTFKE